MSVVTSPKRSPWQTGLAFSQRGLLYASPNDDSEPSTTEISSLSESTPHEESPSSTSLNPCVPSRDLNKALPVPPSRIHSLRHSLMTLWYYRLKKLEGYHFGVLCCAVVAAVVLIINLTLTIWAVSSSRVQNGLGTLQDGSCKRTATLTFWAHLAINVLSTLLLGASNYSIWLDIAVPSVRNLRHLPTARVTLWWLLAISSIPLHLLYNSAVFSTSCSHEYNAFLVSSEFLNGAPFSFTKNELKMGPHDEVEAVDKLESQALNVLEGYQKNQTALERLDVKTCVEIYTAPSIPSHSDVLLVSNNSNFTNSLLGSMFNMWGGIDGNCANVEFVGWSFTNSKTAPSLSDSICALKVYNHFANLSNSQYGPKYCLSVPAEEHCKLQFSLAIMLVVIVCNLIKTVCMITIAWRPDAEPLVTLGDAVASFMDRPDVTTKGNCIAENAQFQRSRSWEYLSRKWDSKSLLLFRAASSRRWIICNILCIAALTIACFLLGQGLNNSNLGSRSMLHLWSLGFGNVNSETLVTIDHSKDLFGAGGVLLIVLVANSPQIILSFLYFSYNGIFTCMLLAKEWRTYGSKRNFLRVTTPSGRQRSTYRLQLPYRYGVPLLISSGILHWLVSQSIFLVRIDVVKTKPVKDTGFGVSTCGYSPMAIIFTIILGFIVILVGIANGFRKVKAGMPLAGSCSAAISAACHPPKADVNASSKRLMWGVVAETDTNDPHGRVGHCSFTSFEVETPIVGRRYAGLQS